MWNSEAFWDGMNEYQKKNKDRPKTEMQLEQVWDLNSMYIAKMGRSNKTAHWFGICDSL